MISAGGAIVEASGHLPGLMDEQSPSSGRVSLLDAMHPDDLPGVLAAFTETLANHRIARRVRTRIRNNDDEWQWVEAHLHGHQHGDESVVSCLLGDVRAEEQERAALAERERVLRTLNDALPVGVVAADDVGTIRYANKTFREITGIDPTRHDWLDYVDPEDVAELANQIARLGFYGEGLEMDLRLQRPGETQTRLMRLVLQAVRAQDGKLLNIVGSIADVTDSRGETSRLDREAHQDALTGLVNRAGIERELGDRLDRFHTAREPLAVLFVDLDDFGRINDAFGHTQGDEVLLQIGQRLRAETRDGDVVGRFGGDEFVVIADQTGGPDGALGLAHRLGHAVAAPVRVSGTSVRPHASIGIALSTGPGTRIDTLVREADAALREAKRRGRGVVWLADGSLRNRLERQVRLEQALDRGFDPETFTVAYQPVHDLITGEIYGAEGVVRWDSPDHGLLTSDQIVPVAEQSGHIHHLGTWSTRRIAEDYRALRDRIDTHPGFRLGVHLSARQLAGPGFVERAIDDLAELGLGMDALVVEVRRGHLVGHDPDVAAAIDRLTEAGAVIALDEFGGDSVSFEDLYRYPVRYLKLDERITADLAQSATSRTVDLPRRRHVRRPRDHRRGQRPSARRPATTLGPPRASRSGSARVSTPGSRHLLRSRRADPTGWMLADRPDRESSVAAT